MPGVHRHGKALRGGLLPTSPGTHMLATWALQKLLHHDFGAYVSRYHSGNRTLQVFSEPTGMEAIEKASKPNPSSQLAYVNHKTRILGFHYTPMQSVHLDLCIRVVNLMCMYLYISYAYTFMYHITFVM